MKIGPRIYKTLPKSIRKRTNKLYKYLPRSKKTVIKTINGITYELDLSTVVHSQIYHYGFWEEDVTNIINNTVKKGMTCFDIGASTGPHTLRMAKLVGKNGLVCAFEPSQALFPKLVKNIVLNDFKNVRALPVALSDKEEKKMYYTNTLFKLGNEEEKSSDKITVFDTVDKYVKRYKIKSIDFIKLDVDGYETKIIKGGFNSIKKFKPVMIVEFSKGAQEEYGSSLEELADVLMLLGYNFYNTTTLEQYNDIIKATPETGSINVLCLLCNNNK